MDKIGTWPISRYAWANTIAALEFVNPKFIIFDMLFLKPNLYDLQSDNIFTGTVAQFNNVYLSMNFDNYSEEVRKPVSLNEKFRLKVVEGALADNEFITLRNVRTVMPQLMAVTSKIGAINVTRDEDGVIRNATPVFKYKKNYYPNLSLLVALDYMNVRQVSIKKNNILIDKKDYAKLKEPINTIKKGNKTLIDTISSGRLKDEKLMEITLATTEDINQTLSREEELKQGNIPNKFTSYFVLNEIIPIGNKSRTRAKSERKKGLNKKSSYEKTNKNDNNNIQNTNIKNVDDIFDLFSTKKSDNNISNNNNQSNTMISNYYTNQNNKIFDMNQMDDMQNYNNNNFNNYNINNGNKMNQMNNQNGNYNNNNTFIKNNPKNKMIDLFQDNQNMNQANNNFQNPNNFQNKNNNKSDEFDIYGPAPEINSNQLVNYIGEFNSQNNNNNQYQNFNNIQNQNNNFNFGQNQNSDNNFGNNVGNNHQMTQEEIEREQRLKELDELF